MSYLTFSSSTAVATHGSSDLAVDCPSTISDPLCLAQPHRQHRRLFPDNFIYSGKQAASPYSTLSFFCACDRRGGLLHGFPQTMVCQVVPSALHIRYCQYWCVPSSSDAFSGLWQARSTHRHGGLDVVLGIHLPPRRLPRRVTPIFIYSAFTYTPPPLAPTMGRSLPYSRYLQFLRLFGTVPHDSCGSFLSVVMYLFPINLVGARHITWNACCLISAFKREVVFP